MWGSGREQETHPDVHDSEFPSAGLCFSTEVFRLVVFQNDQNEKLVSISKILINFSYLLYLCLFVLEINIKMCKIYTTVLISR